MQVVGIILYRPFRPVLFVQQTEKIAKELVLAVALRVIDNIAVFYNREEFCDVC